MRAAAGIICGLIAGLVATILVGIVGVGATFTAPPGIDPSNSRQVLEAFADMPDGSKIALMVAWFAGGLVGALVAKAIARRSWAAWAVAIVTAAYVLLNVLVLPMPGWMQALSVAAPLIGALIGNHLIRAAAPAEAAAVDPAAEI
jgi:hypothetical protein